MFDTSHRSSLRRCLFCCLLWIGVVTTNVAHAVSPAQIAEGKQLFEREWTAKSPRMGSDGLGPLFNGSSCVACHRDGGVGGSGDTSFNANTLAIEYMRIDAPGINDDVVSQMTSLFHPGFVSPAGRTINTFTVPHRGGSPEFRQRSAALLKQVAGQRSEFGGAQNSEEVRLANATPILFEHRKGSRRIAVRARLFQRNTPPLFGSGLIDNIDIKAVEAEFRRQKSHPEISGRPATLRDGRIGRFGWRGNVATLTEFVDQACANEVGLETRRKPQAIDPTNRNYRNPTFDISDEAVEAMAAFVSQLPPPAQVMPESSDARAEVQRGQEVFNSVGCAVCHVPELGNVAGIFSDLLLHDMGYDMIDFNAADPYVIRRTPLQRRSYTRVVNPQPTSLMGEYYGSPSLIVAPRETRYFEFEPPQYPPRDYDIVTLGSSSSTKRSSRTLDHGRDEITDTTITDEFYVRLHYEPTKVNQEWRTPPLWGVADSAPYMHDGRAETLLEAITMHEGEATGTRDRFLNLSLADRHALIAFLNTLQAPPGAPQPNL